MVKLVEENFEIASIAARSRNDILFYPVIARETALQSNAVERGNLSTRWLIPPLLHYSWN